MSARSASPFIGEIEPITASDDELRADPRRGRAAAAAARRSPTSPATCRCCVTTCGPTRCCSRCPRAASTEAQQADAIRELALDALDPLPRRRLPAGAGAARRRRAAHHGVRRRRRRHGRVPAAARGGARPTGARTGGRPTWHKDDVAPGRRRSGSSIIGAGMSGLLAAHRLQQAGVAVRRSSRRTTTSAAPGREHAIRAAGSTTRTTTTATRSRSATTGRSTSRPRTCCSTTSGGCADAFGLRDAHPLRHRGACRPTWSDDDLALDASRVRDADGDEETLERRRGRSARSASSTGPTFPDDPRARRRSRARRSTRRRWDHDVDLAGKRVAVIGTGASAVQFIPEIAADGRASCSCSSARRRGSGPTPDYHDAVSAGLRWLYGHVPSYSEWNRFWIFWRMGDGALAGVRVDPDWDGERRVGQRDQRVHAQMLTGVPRGAVRRPARPARARACPTTRPAPSGCCATTASGPARSRATTSRSSPTASGEITPKGIVTADGDRARGRRDHLRHRVPGVEVPHADDGDRPRRRRPARAVGRRRPRLPRHHVPGFPNLFCLYGPNTNIVVNGSIVYFSECGVRYILGLRRAAARAAATARSTCASDVHDEFNERGRRREPAAWRGAWSDVNSWYKNEHGRVAQNWPFTLLEYWQRTLAPAPDDYDLLG